MSERVLSNLEAYQKLLATGDDETIRNSRFTFPPPIARTLGLKLAAISLGSATIEMTVNLATQANPMGTLHGGVMADLADFAIGTAHATTLADDESFTTVDLQINFFRPIWKGVLRAVAKPVHEGRTVGRYVCDLFQIDDRQKDGKLVAQATSTVMTLRGKSAEGR